ncbi:MAG: excinuclease ABC subunit UvrA [Acidobacteriota bacterium]|nr:excinuclease ABC subunit UvrA [Acidobacteriota bacterium]
MKPEITIANNAGDFIEVRGARTHNLKNVSFKLPVNQMTVVTGVSGSGKSSLAFDTIYAEGQRRYVESLSAYARQFLERMDKPDVDEILGIAPAIAIRQKNQTRNPRSTVATQTEIYDYLRLLFARAGTVFCHVCGREVKKDSPESSANEVLETLAEGMRFYVLFPVKNQETKDKLQIQAVLIELLTEGFSRLFRNGETIEMRTPDDYKYDDLENTFVLVDRLAMRGDVRQRLVDSLEIAFQNGDGNALIETTDGQKLKFSTKFICEYDGTPYLEPEPRLFVFNSPFGACPVCQGFGNTTGLDLDLVVPNPMLSIKEGAIDPFTKPQAEWALDELKKYCKAENISMDVPFMDLSDAERKAIIDGKGRWRGVKGFFKFLETKKYKLHVRVFLAKYRGYTKCPECDGGRLRQEARDVKIAGKNLPEVVALSIRDAAEFFDSLKLTSEQSAIADRLLYEIKSRLRFMLDVGLDYLTLDRLASTLSGGEAQRIQLATNLGSSLVGALYVLDEPSIGLHPRDNTRLIRILHNLRDIGNTILVVEHDEQIITAANHLLDIGVHAGELGGNVVFEGDFAALLQNRNSLTAKYLRGEAEIKLPKNRREPNDRKLTIRGAREHNLKNVDVEIPLEMMVCITGVSGSGKSTLIHDIVYAGLKKQRGEWQGHVGLFKELSGGEHIDDIILTDQSPIGRTPRSNPVTYLKAYDAIREVFAGTNAAQAKGFDASHFSFNVPGGRCEVCQGDGTVTVEMQFLADVELMCEECHGTRFKPNILDVRYKGKNIHDVLNMTVREALSFFKETARVANKLKVLDEVGLGYLRLGQSATTLSGGEAQRVKLAAHLSKKTSAKTLFIFDEPTTGLHFDDISKLLTAFRALINAGNSLLVIEHNLDVIKTADYVIDLGPDGGKFGGEIVATGTPEEIAENESSHTGKFLRSVLANSSIHQTAA